MSDDADAMLEGVLLALTRAEGRPDRLFQLLHETWPEARTTALISGLLAAERALRGMFRGSGEPGGDGYLALAAALALAEAANELELVRPDAFVRLGDILAA